MANFKRDQNMSKMKDNYNWRHQKEIVRNLKKKHQQKIAKNPEAREEFQWAITE